MANKETLSALIDNEHIDNNLLEQVMDDRESTETWQRYHLIGDVLRGDADQPLDFDIADSIAAAIDAEPAIVSPKSRVNEQTKPVKRGLNVVHYLKYAGQYAIAASVAVAAIVGVQQYSNMDPESPLPVLHTIPIGGSVAPVSLSSNAPAQEMTESQLIEQRQRMSIYLQDHRLQQRFLD